MSSSGKMAGGDFGWGRRDSASTKSLPAVDPESLGGCTGWTGTIVGSSKKSGFLVGWWPLMAIAGIAAAVWNCAEASDLMIDAPPPEVAAEATRPSTATETEEASPVLSSDGLAAPRINKLMVGRRGRFLALSLGWSEVAGAERYQLQLSHSPHFETSAVDVELRTAVFSEKHVTAKLRYARVRAKRDDTWSPYSEVFAFNEEPGSRRRQDLRSAKLWR